MYIYNSNVHLQELLDRQTDISEVLKATVYSCIKTSGNHFAQTQGGQVGEILYIFYSNNVNVEDLLGSQTLIFLKVLKLLSTPCRSIKPLGNYFSQTQGS